jgi:cytochrome c
MTHRIFVFIAAAIALASAARLTLGQSSQSRTPQMRSLDSKEVVHRGEAVFKLRCAICHYAASTEKKIGPGLRGISERERLSNGQRVDSMTMTRVIQNGGKDMPPMRAQITDAQLRDLLAYLRTL